MFFILKIHLLNVSNLSPSKCFDSKNTFSKQFATFIVTCGVLPSNWAKKKKHYFQRDFCWNYQNFWTESKVWKITWKLSSGEDENRFMIRAVVPSHFLRLKSIFGGMQDHFLGGGGISPFRESWQNMTDTLYDSAK